jgi:hypothetical protein
MGIKSKSFQSKTATDLEKIGNNTPVLLVMAIQDQLMQSALNWLHANDVPQEVWEAFDLANLLSLYVERIKTGTMSASEASELPDHIVLASNLSIKFGGDYLNGWQAGHSQVPNIR